MRKLYLTILYIVTVICVIVGLVSHVVGFAFRAGKVLNLSFFSGTRSSARVSEDLSKEGSGESFRTIDIDIDAANVIIEAGDAFSVNWDGDADMEPKVENKGDTLRISQDGGFHILPNFSGSDVLTITVPQSQDLKKVKVDLDAGNLTLSGITAGDAGLDLSMGNITIADAEFDELTVDADMGNIRFDRITAKKGSMDADMGNIEGKYLDGFSSYEMDADLGNITVDLRQEADDLKLDLSADLGKVKINGENTGSGKSGSGSAKLKASASLGNVEVNTSR